MTTKPIGGKQAVSTQNRASRPVSDSASPQADTGTLGKALSVLEIVASANEPMRFTDILAQTSQPRGTLHRHLSNLVQEGFLSLEKNQSYALGLRLLKFAAKAWAGNQFRTIAEPHLRALYAQTGETVHLGVLRGTDVIYLDKVESRQSVRMISQIGFAGPAFCTGVGKAALAALDDDALERVIAAIEFKRFTENTLTTPEQLRSEIREIRQCGNAYDREEHEIGIRCVAAPVYAADRSFVAGLSVTGPAYRVSMDTLLSWSALVRETATAIMDDMEPRLGPRF